MTSRRIPYRVIFLTGVDGSGKTFITNKLINLLNSNHIPATHVWSRFNNFFSKPLLGFTRLLGINYYCIENGNKIGYHDFENHSIISSLFILLQLIDVWIASIFRFWIPILKENRIIIADRGPYDTVIDVALDTGRADLPSTFWGQLYCKSIPFSHRVFLLERDTEQILRSRPDLKHDRKFQKRMKLYSHNEKVLGFQRILNDGDPSDTITHILDCIFGQELDDL